MNRCALILTHGRAKHCVTIGTLRRYGYTGEIVLLLDDEDESANEYRKNYPECKILTFCKQDEMARPFASVDNFGIRGTVLYARNAAWEIMRREGYDEFIMLDDDYSQFQHRWLKNDYLGYMGVRNLDEVFGVFFQFLRDANADVVCFAQGGDYIGGADSGTVKKWISRKAMNVYFFRTKKPYYFVGAMNDDVNTYLLANMRGKKVFTDLSAAIVQGETQQRSGGLTKMYADFGTYNKSFYSVIVCPSAVKISMIGDAGHGENTICWRIHHNITWNNVAPKILSEKWKK